MLLTEASIETSADRECRRYAETAKAIRRDPVLRKAVLLGVAWLIGYALLTAGTSSNSAARQFVGDVVYLVPIAGAFVLSVSVARRATGRRQRFWQLLVASNALWLGGDVTWAGYAYVWHRPAPFPSIADALYLCSYALVPVALLVGFAGASGRRKVRALLDAAVAALGVGALGWELLVAPQLGFGWSLATATGVAYPLLGVIILVTLLSVGIGGHRRVAASLWLIGAAFAVSAATDAGYTYLSSLHSYLSGDWLDLGWQAEAVLMCIAALCAGRHDEGDAQVDRIGRDVAVAPVLAGVGCALLLAGGEAVRLGVSSLVVACAGLVVLGLVVRFALSMADHRHVAQQLDLALQEQQRLAVTDGLTGLYNRRFFEEVLQIESDRARRNRSSVALIVADLDHFKSVNDVHGHPNGDLVLVEAAARLRRALRDHDVLARYGGEEFVAILPGADGEVALEIAERCRQAVCGRPIRLLDRAEVTVTCSLGIAALPEGAADVAQLIVAADRAVYIAKDAGRNRVVPANTEREAATAVPRELSALVRLADLIDARLGPDEHSTAMARWAGVLADALGLDAAQRTRAILGARLHDIGKIAIPDSLLRKPGPLTTAEWNIMRTHPDEGARLVGELTGHQEVAAIVRGHHERMDGAGYPDGAAAADLPVETRLVSVLDTWATMLAERSYSQPRTLADARAELLAARGTQLDPYIVDVFLDLQSRGVIGPINDQESSRLR